MVIPNEDHIEEALDTHSESGVEEGSSEQGINEELPTQSKVAQDHDQNDIALAPNDVTVDLDSMKDAVFFLFPDRNQRLSRFWLLLVLSAIIATSGVVGDSSATVIGAMIVAPLMTPIMGTMLSIVLTDTRNFCVSLLLVFSGVGTAVLIGFIYGYCVNDSSITKGNNSQVAARVAPRITDLIGALATGAVGSIALVRKDIAGALPGVAISISLVPPLCVCGLMLSSESFVEAGGAMLLFMTNFMSIQVMGVVTMYFYKVHLMALNRRARLTRTAALILVAMLILVAVPLGFSSRRLSRERNAEVCLKEFVSQWGDPRGWDTTVVVAQTLGNQLSARVIITGPPPFPNDEDLNGTAVGEYCPDVNVVEISFLPEKTIEL